MESANQQAWIVLSTKVYAQDWDGIPELVADLIVGLNAARYTDGVYIIGFQRLYDAPEIVKDALDQYHEALSAARKRERKKKRKKKGK